MVAATYGKVHARWGGGGELPLWDKDFRGKRVRKQEALEDEASDDDAAESNEFPDECIKNL